MKDLVKFRPWLPLEDRDACCVPSEFITSGKLSLQYGETSAFKDVSLAINKGCITAVVGPSGCGKTSFLLCLNRLIDLVPNARVSGTLTINRQDILSPATDLIRLRRQVGMIFQKPNPFPLSIRRNIEFPLHEHGVKDREQRAHILESTLREVGLFEEVKDRLDAPALSLSGGQQQRLCIARAIALAPEVLLFDEPCSALDPISSGVVEDLIAEMRGRYTVVIVTHNLAQARRIADYVAIFWTQDGAGKLIESGTAAAVFESPTHALTAAYIGGARG